MEIFRRFGSKLRETNEALATAHKSWRDEQLQERERGATERERKLAEREVRVADQLREIRRLEGRRWFRRAVTTALLLLVGAMSFLLGMSVGSSPASDSKTNSDVALKQSAQIDGEASSQISAEAEDGTQAKRIPVWSDPKASYFDEGSGELPNGNLWSITRRDGPSGVSFSKREIDCNAQTSRYLGEGETLATINDSPDANLSPLTSGSISTLVSDYTCLKHGRGPVTGI